MPVRILIADDNAVFRTTLRQVLQAVDHWDIVEASDGQEAISKAAETLPNLIILDLAMPAKDGLAAAREISQLLPQIPIVMCTMHKSAHLETEALKSGVRKILSKSESSLLVETVRQLLPAAELPTDAVAAVPLPVAEPAVANVIQPLPIPDPAGDVTLLPAVPATPPETGTEPPAPPLPKNVA